MKLHANSMLKEQHNTQSLTIPRSKLPSHSNVVLRSLVVSRWVCVVFLLVILALQYPSPGVIAIPVKMAMELKHHAATKPSLSAQYVYGPEPGNLVDASLAPLPALGPLATGDTKVVLAPATSTVPAPPAVKLGKMVGSPARPERMTKLPKGTIIYHATNVMFDTFRENPTWFSHDPMEGLKMTVLTALTTGTGEDMYVRSAEAKHELKLYVMSPTGAESLAHLTVVYGFPATGTWDVPQLDALGQPIVVGGVPALQPHTGPWTWYGLTSTARPAVAFITQFCAHMPGRGFHGWRNPYDQDEIMLCPQVNDKVQLLAGDYRLCRASVYKQKIGLASDHWAEQWTRAKCDALKPYIVKKREEAVGQPTQRMHYFLITRNDFCRAQTVVETPEIPPRDARYRETDPTIRLDTVTRIQPYDVTHRLYDQLCQQITKKKK